MVCDRQSTTTIVSGTRVKQEDLKRLDTRRLALLTFLSQRRWQSAPTDVGTTMQNMWETAHAIRVSQLCETN